MKHLYILLTLVIFIGCSNDDATDNRSISLEGEWNLVNVTGGFSVIDQDFDTGIIIWEFNESNNVVIVTNNSTITNVYNEFPSGTYTYSIETPDDIEELIVNEINLGTFTYTLNSFTVSQQFRDGFKIRFER